MRSPLSHFRWALLLVALFLVPTARAEDLPVHPRLAEQQAQLVEMMAELKPVVARLRGLEWKREVPAVMVTREQLVELMETEFEEEFPEEKQALYTRLLRRRNLLEPDEDPIQLQLTMLKELVAGAYDPKSKKIYIVEGMVGEGQKPTIVHELTHALDDQYYDLEASEKPYRETDPDRQFAIRCLWEGCAEMARIAYENAHPRVARASMEQQDDPGRAATQRNILHHLVPAYMILDTLLHYRVGPNFVSQAEGDLAQVMDRLHRDPPITQEQFLYPHKWLSAQRDMPRRIVWGGDFAKAVGKGWKKVYESSVGELDLALHLDYFLGDNNGRLSRQSGASGQFVAEVASNAARGWDAGRSLYVEHGDGRIIVVEAYAFDSGHDATEAAEALASALAKEHGTHWRSGSWTPSKAGKGRVYDYTGAYGRGRLLQRGPEVMLLDGAPDTRFEAVWQTLLGTSFERHEQDADAEPALADPLARCDVVDRRRGLGLIKPGRDWRAHALAARPGRPQIDFARATKGGVTIDVTVIDQAVTEGGLTLIAEQIVPGFKADAVVRMQILGHRGLYHPLRVRRGFHASVYVVCDATRTYRILVTGRSSQVAALDAEIKRFIDGGIVSVPGY